MKIAIPKIPQRQSDSLTEDTNVNRKTLNKESKESTSERKTMQNMLSKKHRQDSTSKSSCCTSCSESDDDSDSTSFSSKNKLTTKSLKQNSKSQKNGSNARRNATAKRAQKKANIETSDSNSDSSDESSDSESNEKRSPISKSKQSYKNDFLKSTVNQNLNADGASSSDMELPALVMAAIQCVESCSDGENSKIEQKSNTQYTSSLLRDFVAKTQMMGSNIQNSNNMINSKNDPKHSNNDKTIAKHDSQENTEMVKKKRGRPRKNPLPNTNESASVNNGSPDSGITSTPHSPVPSSRSNSSKSTKKSTTTIAKKIDISTLEKSIYATERVLYPPRRKRQTAQQHLGSTSRNRDDQDGEKVDPIWKKIDINRKFRRPSECGYRSDTNTICSKILAAQSGYTSDYCNVNRRLLSGYKSDYSCKSRRSGYKSDYSLKAKSCGYRSDCSTRHRRKVRRKRRTKTASSTKPIINDQDILMLAGLSLGHSDESSVDSSQDKPQTKSKSPLKMTLASNSISNTAKKPTFTKVPALKSKADDNSSNHSERGLKHKGNSSFDSMLMTMNDSVTTITSSIYKDDSNSLKLDRIKPGLIRRRRSSAVSHCSSHCSTSSRHPFRRRRRKRLKSTTDRGTESNMAKINQQIELLTTSFTSLCAIYGEKPTRDKEKSSQIAKSTGSRRGGKKRKTNQENTEVPTVNATTTSKRRNKKTVQTKSPDDHKLPLKKRHYLLTPGEKNESVNVDEKNAEQTEPDNETESDIGKAITPKKRHLLQTPVDLNDVVDSTDATSNSTCKDLQEIQASVSASITGESVKTIVPVKGNAQSKKSETTRKKGRPEVMASKLAPSTQITATETTTKPTTTSSKGTTQKSKALTTKSAPKSVTAKNSQPSTVTTKSKPTSANTQSLEHTSTSKVSGQRSKHARISKESAPPPGVFEPSIDLELQIPFTEIPIPSLTQKSTTEINRIDSSKTSTKNKAASEKGVVEKLLHRTGAAMKIAKRKRKRPNRTGFPTLKKKKKPIVKPTELEIDPESLIETNVIMDQSKILTCEPKIILNCLDAAQLEKLTERCDRVPSEGEPTGTFIERNSKSPLSIAGSDRPKGKPKTATGRKPKTAGAKIETTKKMEIDEIMEADDSKPIAKRLKLKETETKSSAKQKENTVENVLAPRRGRPSLQKKEDDVVPTKVPRLSKQQLNKKDEPSTTVTKSSGRTSNMKTGKKENESAKKDSEKVSTIAVNKKLSNEQSKSEKSGKRTINGRIIATANRRTPLPVEPEKSESDGDNKNRKKTRREVIDENQKSKNEIYKRIGSPSIHNDSSVVERKRARTEKSDATKSPSTKDKVQSQSKPKSISTETVTDLNDIVPVDDWVKPMDQDPLPEGENIHYSDSTHDEQIPVADSKKSHTKPKKKYLVAGLFSNYYKTDMLLPSDKPKNSTDKKTNDDESTCGSLTPMPFFDKYLLQTQTDFTLPYDLWYAHDNDKLYKNHSWNFKKLRTNIYADSVKPIQSPDLPQCSCKPEYECGDNCLNRLVYTECVPETCPCGDKCRNTKIQKHIVAPVERFMTANKGWGVRTNQIIKKGTYILEYVGEVVSEREFKERMATLYINDIHHYCLHLEGGLFIDGHRMGSDCRFVNHSCEPNCEMQKWSVNGLSRMALFASRDIRPGEELTYDYNFSLFNPAEGQVCRCDSQNCRGVIGGKSQRVRPIENKVCNFRFFLWLIFFSNKTYSMSFVLNRIAIRSTTRKRAA